MKKIILFFSISTIYYTGYSQDKNGISVIPQPVSVSLQKGQFVLNNQTYIIGENKASSDIASLLAVMLNQSFGFPVSKKQTASNEIVLHINNRTDSTLGNEGYTMNISSKKIVLSANKPQGLFYGIQTLMQLLPPSNGNAQTKNIS